MSREKILALLFAAAPIAACGDVSRLSETEVRTGIPVCDVRLSPADNAVRIERYVEEIRRLESSSTPVEVGGSPYSRLGGGVSERWLVERERECTLEDWDAARDLMRNRD